MIYRLGVAAFVATLVSVRLVAAQQPVWGQCGGNGWTGGTTCVSGSVCTKQNDWYSQCLPGSAPSSPTTTSTGTAPTSVPSGVGKANFWFSFGDSYTATGFTTTGAIPAPGNPLGNPAYPGVTGGGGSNWIDVLTTKYNKSLLLTYNYAYSGATIDQSLVPPFLPTIASVKDQVQEFMGQAASKPATAPWTSDNAMFSVWIGINDIGSTYSQGGDRSAFNQQLINAYFAQVQLLVSVLPNAGARNFLFINVPPVDRSPLMISSGASAQATEKGVINDYNTKLTTAIANFKSTNANVTTWQWDSHTVFETILDSPQQFGFPDATSYGASNDFWGNTYHPGSAAHEIFGQDIAALINSTVW